MALIPTFITWWFLIIRMYSEAKVKYEYSTIYRSYLYCIWVMFWNFVLTETKNSDIVSAVFRLKFPPKTKQILLPESLMFVRVLFECCSGVVRELFGSASGIVRKLFESGSWQVRDRFDTDSTQVRVNYWISSCWLRLLPKKCRRNPKEKPKKSAFFLPSVSFLIQTWYEKSHTSVEGFPNRLIFWPVLRRFNDFFFLR